MFCQSYHGENEVKEYQLLANFRASSTVKAKKGRRFLKIHQQFGLTFKIDYSWTFNEFIILICLSSFHSMRCLLFKHEITSISASVLIIMCTITEPVLFFEGKMLLGSLSETVSHPIILATAQNPTMCNKL